MSSDENSTQNDVRQMLDHIADRNKRGQAARKAGEPEVGIYFVYNGEVLIDSKPLSRADGSDS